MSVQPIAPMEDLLFLAQRCPYPPNKGDKITTWNLLKHLGRRYRIHLATFIDDPDDWRHEGVLKAACASVCLRPMDKRKGLVRAASGLLRGLPLSVAFYDDAPMQRWVDERIASGITRVFVYSSNMAGFARGLGRCQRIMDFADIDSDKWAQYARTMRWPMSMVYAREARLLLAWERDIAARFDRSFFISEREAEDFRRMAPEVADKVGVLGNGVDGVYFAPEAGRADPFAATAPGVPQVVFTGAMDYRPNADAVRWFADEVLPALRAQMGRDVHFCIVGSKPAPDVTALAQRPGITVTGRVEDVRPYLQHAAVVVAPMRIARGIQNKVLEGMSMGRTVVASPQGFEGIDAEPGRELIVADGADAFVQACTRVIRGEVDMGTAARAAVMARYDWAARLAILDTVFEASAGAAAP